MSGPGVYVLKRGTERLYAGSTRDLSKRPKKRDKGHRQRWNAVIEANNVELIPCESYAKAYQLEEHIIRTYHPKYNQRCPRSDADMERTAHIIRDNW